jgi:hypothetical protein
VSSLRDLNLEFSSAMATGRLDLLTIIPHNQLETAISYLRKIEAPRSKSKWDQFWKYFSKTWIKEYKIDTWNIHEIVEKEEDSNVINRTNNPLESYNQIIIARLNYTFALNHRQKSAISAYLS